MSSRRNFLRQAVFGGSLLPFSESLRAQIARYASDSGRGRYPVAVATWNNQKATSAAWEVLGRGGRALDAVEAGARVPEADPKDTSVGYGGFPDRDGNVTLDACIMDEEGNAGSVCFLQEIMHAVSVARRVMEKTPHVLLAGKGALDFALSEGFERQNLLTDEARKAWEKWKETSLYKPVINIERHDTIGIIALDAQQRLAGACTTSGMAFKMHGRVGDSPILGAGMYNDPAYGAAASTGLGELVLKTLGSFLLVEEIRRGRHPQKAAELTVKRIAERYPKQARENQVGFVAIDRKGRYGGFALQPGFNYTVCLEGRNQVLEGGSLFG
jgi:N4-(beta-N-acetylglucosaminyl)-L-asparaginase